MNATIFALLSNRGSLTEHFARLMGERPKLVRLDQGRRLVTATERSQLGIEPRQLALVREIKMGKGEQNWLFARTVIPERTLQGPARRIASLNDTPIGKILFGRFGAIRRNMEISLTRDLPAEVAKLGGIPGQALWQRQSIFDFRAGPLLVTEVFLPDCPIYQIESFLTQGARR